MNLTRCSNGHFYDADKYADCPHCNGAAADVGVDPVQQTVGLQQTVGFQHTVPHNNVQPQTQPLTQAQPQTQPLTQAQPQTQPQTKDLKGAVDDVQKTVGMFNVKKGKEPVVGWLVCVDGPHKGEDFRLRMGKNFVGRSQSMDVVLANDASVSREKHTIIVYEPKGNMFIIQAGESKELSYLNDGVVLAPQALNPYDKISLGASTLVFVPFCTNDITWDKYADEEK